MRPTEKRQTQRKFSFQYNPNIHLDNSIPITKCWLSIFPPQGLNWSIGIINRALLTISYVQGNFSRESERFVWRKRYERVCVFFLWLWACFFLFKSIAKEIFKAISYVQGYPTHGRSHGLAGPEVLCSFRTILATFSNKKTRPAGSENWKSKVSLYMWLYLDTPFCYVRIRFTVLPRQTRLASSSSSSSS